MKYSDLIPVWGKILSGYRPFLSIEITRECPLRCPGCYAYGPDHLQGDVPLRQLRDLKGEALIEGVLSLVRKHTPVHLSIVGGEPLVRWRELDVLLPQLDTMQVEVQLVTSAVRPVPSGWSKIPSLHLVVSIDGLPPEHDRRRAPATYERILKNIEGHHLNVHCTVTRLMVSRAGYFDEFARFWSARPEVRKIWFSLYTPQEGDRSAERLRPEDRQRVLNDLQEIRRQFPKVEVPDRVLEGFYSPPVSPQQCIFAQMTTCISADLATGITPCQFGGRPVCAECGCVASAAMASVGRYLIGGLLPVSAIFAASKRFGDNLRGVREKSFSRDVAEKATLQRS